MGQALLCEENELDASEGYYAFRTGIMCNGSQIEFGVYCATDCEKKKQVRNREREGEREREREK